MIYTLVMAMLLVFAYLLFYLMQLEDLKSARDISGEETEALGEFVSKLIINRAKVPIRRSGRPNKCH